MKLGWVHGVYCRYTFHMRVVERRQCHRKEMKWKQWKRRWNNQEREKWKSMWCISCLPQRFDYNQGDKCFENTNWHLKKFRHRLTLLHPSHHWVPKRHSVHPWGCHFAISPLRWWINVAFCCIIKNFSICNCMKTFKL